MSVFRFIRARKAEHAIKTMCRVLEVSRSGYHAWAKRPPSPREVRDRELVEIMCGIHQRARGVYGARRIHAELEHDHGIRVGCKRVERLMRGAGLSGLVKRKRGKTTVSVPGVAVADDLVARRFRPEAPNRLWVADITYLRTWEGWLYLAAVQDAYSRRIVGWSMADHMRKELVIEALEMAVSRRQPGRGLIHHSDHGGQYVSLLFGQKARDHGIAVSMGATGSAYDNAVAETFFATLKKELVHRRSWPSRHELRLEAFEFIEVFYNRQRRHSTLGYRSPAAFEAASEIMTTATQAA